MKYFTKLIVSIALLAEVSSCHSGSKKIKADTTGKTSIVNAVNKQTDSTSNNCCFADDNRDTLTQALITKVIFPNFSVKINNSTFEGYRDDNNTFIYRGDKSDKIDVGNYRMWTLTTQKDTIHLNTDDNSGLDIGTTEILPDNPSDKFEISYSFELSIDAESGKGGVLWKNMIPYKEIKDSLNYYFNVPDQNGIYDVISSKIKEVKKKFNLKDTTFKKEADNSDYGTYTEDGVIYKNQLCEIPYADIIYLKIDRFIGANLAETKYLIINFSIDD